jgi:hypothetical protein
MVKIVEVEGETDCEPLTATGPMPSIVALVAFVVDQKRVADWPGLMAAGETLMLAVGAGGGGGGGVVGGAGAMVFLWHPARTRIAARHTATGTLFSLKLFTVNLLVVMQR